MRPPAVRSAFDKTLSKTDTYSCAIAIFALGRPKIRRSQPDEFAQSVDLYAQFRFEVLSVFGK